MISDLVKAVDLLQNFNSECDWVLVMPASSPNVESLTHIFDRMETPLRVETYDGPSEYAAAMLRAVTDYEEMVFVRDEVVLPSGWSLAEFIKSITCKGPVGVCSLSEVSTAFFYARVDFYHYLMTRVMSAPHFGISHQSLCSVASHFYDWWDPRVTGCVRAPPQGSSFHIDSDRSGHSKTEQWYRKSFPVLLQDQRHPKTLDC